MRNFILIISVFFCFSNCSEPSKKTGQTVNKNKKETTSTPPKKATINATLLMQKSIYRIGDLLEAQLVLEKDLTLDSVRLSINNTYHYTKNETKEFSIESKHLKPGNTKVSVVLFSGDSIQQTVNASFTLLSDITPKNYTYKVTKEWKHNTKSYTQGLEFSDGVLYEGTGQYGESALYKIDLDSEEILQSLNLDKEVFGEGITIIGDQIFQLTWQSSTGFVYDKNTFKKLHSFSYPTEGWGLTHNSTHLIMSDGSEKIYFLDKDYLQETHRIEVYDNQGAIDNLNELERIGDLIYANIYGSKSIVAFEESTGKVVKRIDLSGLPSKKDIKGPIDVLNGIAWDNTKDRLIITGKWWPKYYQIELIEK